MKTQHKTILFYVISGVAFFVIDKLMLSFARWAQVNSLGAEIVGGLLLYLVIFLFFIIGASSLIYPIIFFQRYKWIAFIPSIITCIVTVIFILLPETEYGFWLK